MEAHLLIAVDAFGQTHIDRLARAVDGWATWAQVGENESAEVYGAQLATASMVIGWPEPEWLISSPVRLVLWPSVGYEQVLGKGLEARADFSFCNAAGVYSEGIAEHCLAMMLSLSRRLPQYIRAMDSHTWRQLSGHGEIAGKTVCIIGLGGIGGAIAWRCAALGMRVIGVKRSPASAPDRVQAVYPPERLHEAVAEADFVVVALPGGRHTAGMISGAVFDAMKTGACFCNVGRGSAVDETELIRHLQSGHLAGAGLDVFVEEPLPADSPLWKMDNVIVTPHMAGFTADYADRLCALFIDNLRRFHDRQPLLNVIDLGRSDA